jgi:MFS family permease
MHDRYAGSIMVSLYSLGFALAFPLLASAMRRVPRMQIMLCATLFMVVISTIILSLGWVGTYVLYGGAFALGVSWSMLGILCWSGFADAISRNQACQVSFDYAKFLASSKAGLLIGVALLGTMLSSLDYKSTQASYLMPLMATPSIMAGVVLLLVCLRHRRTARVSRVNRSWRGETVVENHAARNWVSTTRRQNLSSGSARQPQM